MSVRPVVLSLFVALLATPPLAAQSSLDRYIPLEADLAVYVDVARLVQTPEWKMFAASETWAEMHREANLAIDPAADVLGAAFALKLVFDPETGNVEIPWGSVALRLRQPTTPAAVLGGDPPVREVPGVSVPVYRYERGWAAVMPTGDVLVLAHEHWLGQILADARAAPPGDVPPFIRTPAFTPGEAAAAARVPEALREAVDGALAAWQRQELSGRIDEDELIEFSFLYNLARLAADAERATATLNLERDADALQATLLLSDERMLAPLVGVARAMADPLAMLLPALAGGLPHTDPPETPLYTVGIEGRSVRLAASRGAMANMLNRLLAGPEAGTKMRQSMNHLKQIAHAVALYRHTQRAWPKGLADLQARGLLADDRILTNPALAAQYPDGDYALVPLSDAAVAEKAFLKVLAYERWPEGAAPDGRLAVAFADGHVERVDRRSFRALLDQTVKVGR